MQKRKKQDLTPYPNREIASSLRSSQSGCVAINCQI